MQLLPLVATSVSALANSQVVVPGQGIFLLASAWMTYVGFGFAVVVCNCFIIAFSIYVIMKNLDRAQRIIALVSSVVIGVLGALTFTRPESCINAWTFRWRFVDLSHVLTQENALYCVLSYLEFFGVGVLIFSAASFRRDAGLRRKPLDQTSRLQSARDQLTLLHQLLLAGAIALTLAVLALRAQLAINVATVDPERNKTVAVMVSNLVSIYGIAYSAVLFAIFYPIIVHLQVRVQRLADEMAPGTDQAEFLTRRGLGVMPYLRAKELLAVLAPFLTGPITDLLTNIKQSGIGIAL